MALYAKIWDSHAVHGDDRGRCLLSIGRHLLREVTLPQVFEGPRLAGRRPWWAGSNIAVPDHNVPTTDRRAGSAGPDYRLPIDPVGRTGITPEGEVMEFDIDAFRKHRLLKDPDDVGLTPGHRPVSKEFESRRRRRVPRLFNCP